MADHRRAFAKILWGPALANVLNVGWFLDNVSAWPEPRAGSEQVEAPSGIEEAWTVGTNYFLQADLRWIPQTNTASPLATGWDGAAGVGAFLSWAQDKNVFRFFPDATDGATHFDCYLSSPMSGAPSPELDGTRTLTIKIKNTVAAFDGY